MEHEPAETAIAKGGMIAWIGWDGIL